MSVLKYIKQKYKEIKSTKSIAEQLKCSHRDKECTCMCHTHRNLMHIIDCCGSYTCEKCGVKYNKKR